MGTSPQKIGRYEVIGELGKGAMGLVYKALDPMIGRTVAMKTMRVDVHGMESDEMLKRFQNEARAAGVLNHPNIVTIYDAGEQDGLFYIAMEFIEGVTLHSLILQNRVLPVEQIIDVSRQVCAGLDEAHSHGVVHRDVKPANIMIQPDNTVKIMDFGIAKAGGGLTSAGQVLGTPNYMSPEQVKGRQLDGRSDLFSFGVMLYEMVTGEKPFTGQNVTTIIYKIVNEHPIPPRELDSTIHPGLSAVIQRALAKSPDERYQTGAELAKDLSNYKAFANGVAPAAATGEASVAAARAFHTGANEKTVVFDSGAMAKAASGTMPAAAAPVRAIDSTVEVAKKKVAPVVHAAKKEPKLVMMLGAGFLVLLLAVGGIGWARHRSAQQEADRTEAQRLQQIAEQQKAQIEQQVKAAPAPKGTETATPKTETPASSTGDPATTTTAAKPATTTTAATTTPKPVATTPKPGASTPVQPGPAQPATSATSGELQITTLPSGAQVQVDSAIQGTSPFNARNLTPGQHTVVFSKAGFAPATRVIQVAAGKSTPLVVALQAVPMATLAIASQPAGATILIDEKDTGKTTPSQLAVTAGEHHVILRKQGFKDATANTPKLTAGQTFNFSPLLQSGKNDENPFKRLFGGGIPEGKGMANLHTTPKGAQVFMNGFTAPNRTPLKLPLDPGKYDLTFKLEGYKSVTKSVTIEKGKAVELDVTLVK